MYKSKPDNPITHVKLILINLLVDLIAQITIIQNTLLNTTVHVTQ